MNFSNTVTFGTAKANIIDTNVTIDNYRTLTTKGEVVLTSEGKVNANPKVKGANLSIGNKFISTGYDYELNNVDVTGGLSVPVAFMGGAGEKTFKANKFNVNGIVGFTKYNVYSKDTSIALSTRKSGISLYNTNWYMFERPAASYKLRMISMAYLGAPTSCESGAFNNSAKIIFRNDRIYKGLAGRDKLYNGEDNYRPRDHVMSVPYVSDTGYKAYRFCTNKGTNLLAAGAGHNYSGSNYDMTWVGNSYDMSWNHKHGCGKCAYQ